MSNYNDLMNIARIKVFLRNYVYEDTINILRGYIDSLIPNTNISYLPEYNMLKIEAIININTPEMVMSVNPFHEKFKTIFMTYLLNENVINMIRANEFREEDKDICKNISYIIDSGQPAALYGINMIPSDDGGTMIVLITL